MRLQLGSALFALVLSVWSDAAAEGAAGFAVVDLHVDLPYQHGFHEKPLRQGSQQAALAQLQAGRFSGVVLPLFVPRDVSPTGPRALDLEQQYLRVLSELMAPAGGFGLPGCGDARGSTIDTWLAFEGAGPLAEAPESLTAWVARGVRIVGLVHTEHNALASSSGDKRPVTYGLTEAGRDIVRRAHALGVPVDVSHASDRAVTDVLALASRTGGVVVATHSNARRLADHPRNLTDSQLRGIAATGGVVGLNFHQPFVVKGRPATIDDVVRQALHLVKVAGAEHVAIGADFEGGIRPARGLESAAQLPALAEALLAAGLSEQVVAKVFSQNALRVLCRSGN